MTNPLIDKLQTAGWHAQRGSIYSWQHRDGRKLEREQNGTWYLKPIKGKATELGKSMKEAFQKALQSDVRA